MTQLKSTRTSKPKSLNNLIRLPNMVRLHGKNLFP
jgi:hypothetical protein